MLCQLCPAVPRSPKLQLLLPSGLLDSHGGQCGEERVKGKNHGMSDWDDGSKKEDVFKPPLLVATRATRLGTTSALRGVTRTLRWSLLAFSDECVPFGGFTAATTGFPLRRCNHWSLNKDLSRNVRSALGRKKTALHFGVRFLLAPLPGRTRALQPRPRRQVGPAEPWPGVLLGFFCFRAPEPGPSFELQLHTQDPAARCQDHRQAKQPADMHSFPQELGTRSTRTAPTRNFHVVRSTRPCRPDAVSRSVNGDPDMTSKDPRHVWVVVQIEVELRFQAVHGDLLGDSRIQSFHACHMQQSHGRRLMVHGRTKSDEEKGLCRL